MTIFMLKIVALITMFIDHFAFLNLPISENTSTLLREIGRISFPLYIFILTESLYYTKDRKKLLQNLFVFALISQVPFYLYFNQNFNNLNVLFTMLFGSLIIFSIDNIKYNFKNSNIALLTVSLLLPVFFRTDYDILGSYSIVILYYLKRINIGNIQKYNILPALYIVLIMIIYYYSLGIYYILFGSISAIFILFYNHQEGYKMKKLFYYAYPVHITLFLILNTFVFNK